MIKNKQIIYYFFILKKVNIFYCFLIFCMMFSYINYYIKNDQNIVQKYIKSNKFVNIIENNEFYKRSYINKIFIKHNINFFVIQVATYSSENEAWNRYRIFKNEFCLNAFIEKVLINNEIKFRLLVGPFRNIEVANNVKNKLFILGYNNSVILNSE
ncbi:hypothetical protein CKSOR_00297 [Candidatus Kinetoplastibacterium sorsogonicusi]|uniref:SPOR domain-containing protein n=1 Tax=Candidatus Kinetoplastidibacterium kentomonadis TaxID=1576550 RepID=A0A3Q8EWY1_9PROT|nr:SPOR domain-containing protein [Candidatus Kinetoplastibacterium sorsogonicusi]AWD32418.1 hypothetical protein CKSOR_00297 [Candidatus Kinetoplastibacterium sorsogonicusi]